MARTDTAPPTRPIPAGAGTGRDPRHPAGVQLARVRSRSADLLENCGVALLIAPVVIFLADGGGPALLRGGVADRLLVLGRLTGLEATAVLLLQMLLSARVPWIDRTYGHDRALVAHRLAARISIPLLLAHVITLIVGYTAMDGLAAGPGWVREAGRMIGGTVPDMLTAFVSFAVILLVAATSVRLARRRVSYEAWHLVHVSAYAGVALSVPHQLSAGTDIAGHPIARLFWLGLYAATAGTAIGFRVVLPVWYSLRHRLRVEQVIAEGPGVTSIVISGRGLHLLPARAGQFFHWRFLSRGLWAAAHPWSLSAAPDGHRLRITVRDLGDHSRLLSRLRPGTRVIVEGPYGAFTSQRRTRRKVLLLAAGIGITPVRALLEDFLTDPRFNPSDLTLLYRSADAASLVFVEEIREAATDFGVRVYFLLGPGSSGSWLPSEVSLGRHGEDAAALERLVPGVSGHDVYQCGPPGWMTLVRRSLRAAGVPADQVHDERFAW